MQISSISASTLVKPNKPQAPTPPPGGNVENRQPPPPPPDLPQTDNDQISLSSIIESDDEKGVTPIDTYA